MSAVPSAIYPNNNQFQIFKLQVGTLEWLYTGGDSPFPPKVVSDAKSLPIASDNPATWYTFYNLKYTNQTMFGGTFEVVIGKTNSPYGNTRNISGNFTCKVVDNIVSILNSTYTQTYDTAPAPFQISDDAVNSRFQFQIQLPVGEYIATVHITITYINFGDYI